MYINTMHANPIPGLLVLEAGYLPGSGPYFVTTCLDYEAFRRLPAGAVLENIEYALTGWNSDTCRAYYKAGKRFAVDR